MTVELDESPGEGALLSVQCVLERVVGVIHDGEVCSLLTCSFTI